MDHRPNGKMQKCKTPRSNIGGNLGYLEYGSNFLDKTPKAQSIKEISDKLDCVEIKNICSQKGNVKRMRRQDTDWEKNLQKTHLLKNCYSK